MRTPGSTIRGYCVYCNGGLAREVATCDADCPFHKYRMGRGRPSVKVIRKFCLQCMGGHSDFVRDCTTLDCLCYPYRFGKNPNMAHVGFASAKKRGPADDF